MTNSQNPNQYKQDPNSSAVLPGESDPEFSRVVREYLANFGYYRIKKSYALRDDLYEWCAANLGEKYKDWFIFEGGRHDKFWTVNIRSPKRSTFFALRWADIIIESVDRRK